MSSYTSNIAIRLTDISKTFYVKEKSNDSIMLKFLSLRSNSQKKKIEALKDINITIERGEFVGIIGHNGSGKSTMLKLITSAFPPNKGGTIEVNGKVIRLSLGCLLYTSPSPRDLSTSRMPSSA